MAVTGVVGQLVVMISIFVGASLSVWAVVSASASITVFELWQGLEIKDSKKREKILNILQSIGLLSFDFNSAKEAGNIYRELRKKGITIDAEDTMIAGIAKIYNETLLTRNVKDFRRIENLKVEGY